MDRKIKTAAGLAAALAFMGLSGAADAHHSFAMFDVAKVVTLKGSVKSFSWTNPHVVLFLYGAPVDGGEATTWAVELTSPGNLTRLGWSKRSLNPGDSVLVEVNPLRDGQPGGGFRKVTIASTGQILAGR